MIFFKIIIYWTLLPYDKNSQMMIFLSLWVQKIDAKELLLRFGIIKNINKWKSLRRTRLQTDRSTLFNATDTESDRLRKRTFVKKY